MKLLIIDIGTERLDELHQVCGRYDCDVVPMDGWEAQDLADYSALIISGDYTEDGSQASDQSLQMLIKAGDMPVVGICKGFEAICYALGVELAAEAELIDGAERIIPTEDGAKLFQGSDPMRVRVTRRWCLEELPRGISALVRSDSGIDALRHKARPLIGLQLRPQDFLYPSDAKLVFENIVAVCARRVT